ncbi:MAG: sugar phosphate isomerase/epimerase family protein [Planctomycetota bacterium]
MPFAFSTILHADRTGWSPAPTRDERARVFRWAVDHGFDGLEWSPRWCDVHDLGNRQIEALGREVSAANTRVVAINLNRFLLIGHSRASEYQSRTSRAIDFASRMNCPVVVISLSVPAPPGQSRPIATGNQFSQTDWRQTRDLLRMFADQAAEQHVALSLELHDDGMLDTAERTLKMIDSVGRDNVGSNPDLGNLIRQHADADWESALRLLAPSMNHWHVKNYRDRQPMPLHSGSIDYLRACRMVMDQGYKGWISMETYFGDDLLSLQLSGLAYLSDTLASMQLQPPQSPSRGKPF